MRLVRAIYKFLFQNWREREMGQKKILEDTLATKMLQTRAYCNFPITLYIL